MKQRSPSRPPKRSRFSRSQRSTIATGILFLVATLVVLQLWLFTATMNAYLGGDTGILLPAAIASLVALGLNIGLLYYLNGLD